MSFRPIDLPDFERPPLTEVVLSVQFESIEGLHLPHLGLLWERFRKDLPNVEEHPPLAAVTERFGVPAPPRVDVIIDEKPPVPRVWFLNLAKTELIQVQPDRFIHNWRKLDSQKPYPRYESVRDKFQREVETLEAFLAEEKLGPLKVTQCEITYVNHIEPNGIWERHGQISTVLRNWSDLPAGSFLPEPEDIALRWRYVITDEQGKASGRLHAVFQPGWKTTTQAPVFTLNLTARGTPTTDDIKGAFSFFDLGRRWIVKGFADLTSEEIQKRIWGRK